LSGGATLAAGNAMIASSLNALVTDNRQYRQANEIRRDLEKTRTPEKYFGCIAVIKLLHFPELWQNLAADPCRQDSIVTIQQALHWNWPTAMIS
jgi:hypothetical protein